MIILAHDGSIYSDWVARYAIYFAVFEPDRKLLTLHVEDGKVSQELVVARFAALQDTARQMSVNFLSEFLPLGKSVHRSLRQAIPHDPEALLVCGTRVKPRKQAFLAGSISEKLLKMHECPVTALRIVQPGLLGVPQDLLLPVTGRQSCADAISPLLRRFAPRLRRLHLLRVLAINHVRHPHLTPARERLLRQEGDRFLNELLSELAPEVAGRSLVTDRCVRVAPDWANEILVHASRLKVQLLMLGASERTLAHRVFHNLDLEHILRDTSCDVALYRQP